MQFYTVPINNMTPYDIAKKICGKNASKEQVNRMADQVAQLNSIDKQDGVLAGEEIVLPDISEFQKYRLLSSNEADYATFEPEGKLDSDLNLNEFKDKFGKTSKWPKTSQSIDLDPVESPIGRVKYDANENKNYVDITGRLWYMSLDPSIKGEVYKNGILNECINIVKNYGDSKKGTIDLNGFEKFLADMEVTKSTVKRNNQLVDFADEYTFGETFVSKAAYERYQNDLKDYTADVKPGVMQISEEPDFTERYTKNNLEFKEFAKSIFNELADKNGNISIEQLAAFLVRMDYGSVYDSNYKPVIDDGKQMVALDGKISLTDATLTNHSLSGFKDFVAPWFLSKK